MKQMRRSAAIVLLVWGMCCTAGEVFDEPEKPWQPLSLTQEEAIRYALENNAVLARIALDVRRRELALRGARHDARGIRIQPVGSASSGSEETRVEAGLRAGRPLPWGGEAEAEISSRRVSLRDAPGHRAARVAVELSQPLFRRFGREARDAPVDEADERLRAERRRWFQQQAGLAVEVVRLFEDIQWTLRRIETDEAFVERMDALRQLTAAREGREEAGRVDALKVELQLGEAELRLHTSRDRLAVLHLELCERLGIEPHTHIILDPAPIPEVPDIEAAEAVAVAYGWRMDYAQLLDDIRSEQRRLSLARRGLQPDLVVRTRYERHDAGAHRDDAMALSEDRWALELGWDWDLRREDARIAVTSAELDVDIQRRRLDGERLRIVREVQSRLLAHRRARAEEQLASRNRRLAEDRAELARTLYRAGRGDAFTVSDAEATFLQADLAWLAKRRDVTVTAYAFLESLGTLVAPPEDLMPVEGDAGEEEP